MAIVVVNAWLRFYIRWALMENPPGCHSQVIAGKKGCFQPLLSGLFMAPELLRAVLPIAVRDLQASPAAAYLHRHSWLQRDGDVFL